MEESITNNKVIIAFVGMPGAGKSEATKYLHQKGVPFVRFGQLTEDKVKEMGLPLTVENERIAREKLREELGMGAFAIKAEHKIQDLLNTADVMAIDGLYSWEEYVFLKQRFPELILIVIFAEPKIRYARLSKRPVRPVPIEKSRDRDIAELENLNKGGPIAIADYVIENDEDNLQTLYQKIDSLLKRLDINIV